MGEMPLADSILCDGLTDAFHNYHMGITGKAEVAENTLTLKRLKQVNLQIQQPASLTFVLTGKLSVEWHPEDPDKCMVFSTLW